MAINKKLIHFNKLSDFETRLANNEILDTSIVFIKDAKKIWTHSNFYDCDSSNLAELIDNKIDKDDVMLSLNQGNSTEIYNLSATNLRTSAISGDFIVSNYEETKGISGDNVEIYIYIGEQSVYYGAANQVLDSLKCENGILYYRLVEYPDDLPDKSYEVNSEVVYIEMANGGAGDQSLNLTLELTTSEDLNTYDSINYLNGEISKASSNSKTIPVYVDQIIDGEVYNVNTGIPESQSNSFRTSQFATLGKFNASINFGQIVSGTLYTYAWDTKGNYQGSINTTLNNVDQHSWTLLPSDSDAYYAFSLYSSSSIDVSGVYVNITYSYAQESDIPTKTSQLTNDSQFITSDNVPEEVYIFDTNSNTNGTTTLEILNSIISAKSVIIKYNSQELIAVSKTGAVDDYVNIMATDFSGNKYSINILNDIDAGVSWKLSSSDFNPVNVGKEVYRGMTVVRKSSSQTTQTAQVNKAYIWRGTGPSSITVTLPNSSKLSTAQTNTEEILLEFQVPSSTFSLTFNGTVAWANGESPIFESGGTYQIHLTARHTNTTSTTVTWLGICSPKFTVTYS